MAVTVKMEFAKDEYQPPQALIDLTKRVFGKYNACIYDWDLDRIYIHADEERDYTIRMWNIEEFNSFGRITWTLFLDILEEDGSGHGMPCKEGTFRYKIGTKEVEVCN